MRNFSWLVPILTLFAAHAAQDANRRPVLLELFTSEGCSSCPPADRLLAALDSKQPVAGADLIVLSEHVDYWNHLGWKDPFSSPQYSARQQDYANNFKSADVYTPELVVDGRFEGVGSDESEAASLIRKAIREPKIPLAISSITRATDHLSARIDIPAFQQDLKLRKAVLYAALADNRDESHVARGENAGHSLAHVAVARVLEQVGTVDLASASSKDVTLPVDSHAGPNASRLVVFIQDPASGHILGVAMARL